MSPKTVLVIENHYLGAIIDKCQFDTFYHEHPRSYSFKSFEKIAQSLGVQILAVEFPSRYGGNIRVFLGHPSQLQGGRPQSEPAVNETDFLEKLLAMGAQVKQWQSAKQRRIADLVREHGKLRAKAFPGRAAILIKLLGLDEQSISAVYEKPGSMKIGNYIPGTRIPIESDDTLFGSGDLSQPVLNLAWHISSEIREYMKSHGYVGPIIDIIDPQDFA